MELVDDKEINTPLLKTMISAHIIDINNYSCSNIEGIIPLKYLEKGLLLDRFEAHVIPYINHLLNSSIPKSIFTTNLTLLIQVYAENPHQLQL